MVKVQVHYCTITLQVQVNCTCTVTSPPLTPMRKKQIRNNFDCQWGGGGCVVNILTSYQHLGGPLFQLLCKENSHVVIQLH